MTPRDARAPYSAVACGNEGMIDESCCSDADCESAPGVGDEFCGACRITGGVSTENETYILIGTCWVEG